LTRKVSYRRIVDWVFKLIVITGMRNAKNNEDALRMLMGDSNYSISGWWFDPSEKYDSQLGSLFPIYGKIKFMFQTTNQIY
jgi:hypothetical protein